MIVQWILSSITAGSPMVGTPINQVQRPINQSLIKDLILPLLSVDLWNGENILLSSYKLLNHHQLLLFQTLVAMLPHNSISYCLQVTFHFHNVGHDDFVQKRQKSYPHAQDQRWMENGTNQRSIGSSDQSMVNFYHLPKVLGYWTLSSRKTPRSHSCLCAMQKCRQDGGLAMFPSKLQHCAGSDNTEV